MKHTRFILALALVLAIAVPVAIGVNSNDSPGIWEVDSYFNAGGVPSGTVDFDGQNQIYDQDGDTYVEGDRSATVSDDQFQLRIGGTSMLTLKPSGLVLEGIELTATDAVGYAQKLLFGVNVAAGTNATHGQYINMTDIASPGLSNLLWAGVGSSPRFLIDSDGTFDVTTATGSKLHLYSTGEFYVIGPLWLNGTIITRSVNAYWTSISDLDLKLEPHGTGNIYLNKFTCVGDGTCSCIVTGDSDLCVENDLEVEGNIAAVSAAITTLTLGNAALHFGNGSYYGATYFGGNDGLRLATGVFADGGRVWTFTDFANLLKAHHHSAQPNPTYYFHSAADVDAESDHFWSFAHTGTVAVDGNFVIGVGNGGIVFSPVGDVVKPDITNTVDLGDADTEWKDLYVGGVGYIGSVVVDDFEKHHDMDAGALASVGVGSPTYSCCGTYCGPGLDNVNEKLFDSVEIVPEWNGTSNMTLHFHTVPTDGDPFQAGEDVDIDVEWRSVDATTDTGKQGTVASDTGSYTEPGTGDECEINVIAVTIPYTGGNQPLTVADDLGITFIRNTASESSSYSGNILIYKLELIYTATGLSTH